MNLDTKHPKKLNLSKEILRSLKDAESEMVVGGMKAPSHIYWVTTVLRDDCTEVVC